MVMLSIPASENSLWISSSSNTSGSISCEQGSCHVTTKLPSRDYPAHHGKQVLEATNFSGKLGDLLIKGVRQVVSRVG